MIKTLIAAAVLTVLTCSVSLAADPGGVPQYCEGAQILGDGSWYAKSDMTIDGVAYPAMTVFTAGQMMNGKDIAAMLSDSCLH